MNVETMTIDPALAREKLKAYRARTHKDAEAEYSAAAKLFEAAADGDRLIVAGDVIRNSPFDEMGRPKLAIARADRKQVALYRQERDMLFDSRANHSPYDDHINSQLMHRYAAPYHKQKYGWERWYATVPMVPADVRPETGQLRQWHILWEVDIWLDRPVVEPPRDPFLLEHVAGDVFKVIAEWDLTPLEQQAMRLAIS